MRCRLVALLLLCGVTFALGDESRMKDAKRRLDFMNGALGEYRVSAKDIPSLSIGKTPLLRYNDPTRGRGEASAVLLDGCVWRVGENGRPVALVTMELYRVGPMKTILSHEFVSLTPIPLEWISSRGPKWTPSSTELKLVPLPEAPRPPDSERARLVQMRQLARRFSVQEDVRGNKIECRLLPQPIDRYADSDEEVLDGAIFVFANGTNPELGLILECTETEWSYGVCRLTSAALSAWLDDKLFYEVPRITQSGAADPYVAKGYPIKWPE